jgi:hypothetical protein
MSHNAINTEEGLLQEKLDVTSNDVSVIFIDNN